MLWSMEMNGNEDEWLQDQNIAMRRPYIAPRAKVLVSSKRWDWELSNDRNFVSIGAI